MAGPVSEFVEDRAVVFVLVLEPMFRRAEDEIVRPIVQGVVRADPNVGTSRLDRLFSRFIVHEAGVDRQRLLLDPQMVQMIAFDLIDVEDGSRS